MGFSSVCSLRFNIGSIEGKNQWSSGGSKMFTTRLCVLSLALFLDQVWLADGDCPPGQYGVPCQLCGRCNPRSRSSITQCDPETGNCPIGCQNGWRPPKCNSIYPILRDPPSFLSWTSNGIKICWKRWSSSTGIGVGQPVAYVVQIREDAPRSYWHTVKVVQADKWDERDESFTVTSADMNLEVDVLIRVLVRDMDGTERGDGASLLTVPFSKRDLSVDEMTIDESSSTPPSLMEEEPEVVTDEDEQYETNDSFKRTTCKPSVKPSGKSVLEDIQKWGIWLGIAIGLTVLTAIVIVIIVECRSAKRSREGKVDGIRLEFVQGTYEPSPAGIDNDAYVTLRRDHLEATTTISKTDSKKRNPKPNQAAITIIVPPTSRLNRGISSLFGSKRRAVGGDVESSTDSRYPRDSDSSWHTEWYANSRIYENQPEQDYDPNVYYPDGPDKFDRRPSDAPPLSPFYSNTIEPFHGNTHM